MEEIAHSDQHMKVNFVLPVETKQVDGWVVAYCPALDVSSQGRTHAQAIAAVKEAVTAFIEFCIENKTIERVLQQMGFRKTGPSSEAPNKEEIVVPIELVAHAQNSARTLAHPC